MFQYKAKITQKAADMSSLKNNDNISSLEFFNINRICWNLLGLGILRRDPTNSRWLPTTWRYIIYAIIVHLIATCSFPVHLSLGVVQSQTQSVLFDSISITITSIGASIKLLIIASKMKKIAEMESLIRVLDARVTHREELQHFRKNIRRSISNFEKVYLVMYLCVGTAATGAFLSSKERRLFYPGWLPFEWRESNWHYAAALGYQFIGISLQMMQTFCNDSFSPKLLCVLSAHIKLLYMRVARIGNESSSAMASTSKVELQEQEDELNRCVLDQINLYELYNTIQDIISWAMLLQFFISVTNNCVAMVVLLFFATDLFDRIYYCIYIIAMAIQLFPTCYYGSDFVLLFEQLHYAVFSCNWIGQSKSFKRHMMIFTERSLRKTVALAGGIFPIHLDTFFATCKAAYSLFALIMTMK